MISAMEHTSTINWNAVIPVAERLGVGQWAVTKWKQRNAIPSRWHLPLIHASAGQITFSDLGQSFVPTSSLPAVWSSQGCD